MENDSEETVDVEEVVEETTEDVEEQEDEETVESLKKKLATTIAQKDHFKEKAEKQPEAPRPDSNLSTGDLLAVMNANVHEDDMERVEKFAKMEGSSIKDALQNPDLKAMLERRGEERETANATNVTNTRKGTTKLSDDAILANANKGKLPEDEAGIAALVAAKRKLN